MRESVDVHWFCGGCEAKVVESINTDDEYEKRCEEFFGDISRKMSAFEYRIKYKLEGYVGREEMDNAAVKLNENFESS